MIEKRRPTRREFLRSALAAVAMPCVVSSTALGAGDRAAPSNRLRLAHIGIGNQGGGHFGAMLGNRDVQIQAVCDVKEQVRYGCQQRVDQQYADERSKGTYKGCAAYNDFRDVMARADIDAVIIAVPDHWHAIVACAAAASGKDVYCEKPMALTIREARKMVETVRRYGRVFQTGSQQRSEDNFRYACELVRNGRIGKVQSVHVGVGGPSSERYYPEEPVPPGFDWDMWQGPTPWHPYNAERCSGNYGGGWRLVRDYSGGMMTDWGAHHFDIAQWGLGMDDSGPVEIHPPDGKEYKTLTYIYANGIPMYHGGANGILFTGAEGKIEVNRGYLKSWPDTLLKEPIGPDEIHLHKSRGGHHGDWFDSIRTRERPVADVEIGCRTVTVCHLGNIAYWTGHHLKWDPAKEEILGDDEAARWLDRPKRAPWAL